MANKYVETRPKSKALAAHPAKPLLMDRIPHFAFPVACLRLRAPAFAFGKKRPRRGSVVVTAATEGTIVRWRSMALDDQSGKRSPSYFRNRAEELVLRAEEMQDDLARRSLLQMAKTYETMAVHAERTEARGAMLTGRSEVSVRRFWFI